VDVNVSEESAVFLSSALIKEIWRSSVTLLSACQTGGRHVLKIRLYFVICCKVGIIGRKCRGFMYKPEGSNEGVFLTAPMYMAFSVISALAKTAFPSSGKVKKLRLHLTCTIELTRME
jgi:hypothetical protein